MISPRTLDPDPAWFSGSMTSMTRLTQKIKITKKKTCKLPRKSFNAILNIYHSSGPRAPDSHPGFFTNFFLSRLLMKCNLFAQSIIYQCCGYRKSCTGSGVSRPRIRFSNFGFGSRSCLNLTRYRKNFRFFVIFISFSDDTRFYSEDHFIWYRILLP